MVDPKSQPQNQAAIDAYQYNYTYVEPIAMVDKLPQGENFSFPWIVLTAKQAIKLLINILVFDLGEREQAQVEDRVKAFLAKVFVQTLQAQGTSFKLKLMNALKEFFPQQRGGVGLPELATREDIAVAVPRGIETALQQMLTEMDDEVATPRGAVAPVPMINTPLAAALQNVPSTAPAAQVEAEVSTNVRAALEQQIQAIPAKESEIETFLRSNLIKTLGVEFLKSFAQNLLAALKAKAPQGKATSIDEYRQLFAYLPLPDIAKTFETDLTFASMRVAGPNPAILTRLNAIDDRFPVTESQYQAVMGSADSLGRAIEEGRVYIVDYAIMSGALNGTFGDTLQVQKYAYAPLAMFAVPMVGAADRSLLPIAIQCGQSPSDHPVITPATGADVWQMAKTVVQIADANYHEAISHFARTHLFIETFVVATHRTLTNHHLGQLLFPHFQGTLAINFAAHEQLVAPKGGVNRLLSSTIDNSRVAIVAGLQAKGFNAEILPRQLRDRGVDDTTTLPIYPYRDDALLVWGAIHDWVAAYLGLFYSTDAAVVGDADIQAWAAELVAFHGGRVRDFGDLGDGKISTLAYLIDAATTIIFTASAQHAAVNFPQSTIMSFAPAMPTAGYAASQSIETDSVNWFDLLPPLEQAQAQLNLTYLLGSVYFTTLGNYEQGYFTNPGVAAPLAAFQQRLKEIEAIVEQRNQTRPVYDHLRPSKIPQSINI